MSSMKIYRRSSSLSSGDLNDRRISIGDNSPSRRPSGEVYFPSPLSKKDFIMCIMACLFTSLEKLNDKHRRIFFYCAFFLGGLLTISGFGLFASPFKGWAFVLIVAGVFILITTGILWDTLAPMGTPNPEEPSAPACDDINEPPPNYEDVMRGDLGVKKGPKSPSRWSLSSQAWCVSCSKDGYEKTCTQDLNEVSCKPPAYKCTGCHANAVTVDGDVKTVNTTTSTSANESQSRTEVPQPQPEVVVTIPTASERPNTT